MNAAEFLAIINANRDMLSDNDSVLGDDTWCPLGVAISVWCKIDVRFLTLFTSNGMSCDPMPEQAADALYLDNTFTEALAHGWDDGTFYNDTDGESWYYEFAGYLIGVTLRPPRPLLQLTG